MPARLRRCQLFGCTGVVGAYLGRTLFVKTIDPIGASRAQSLNNSTPLITVLLAALFLGEPLTSSVLIGVLLIISGVFFIAETDDKADVAPARKFSLSHL